MIRRAVREDPLVAELQEALEPTGPTRSDKVLLVCAQLLLEIRDTLRARGDFSAAAASGAPSHEGDELLTVKDVGRLLRRSTPEVYELMKPGPHGIKYIQRAPGAKRFIRRSDVQEWLRAHEIGGAS